MPDRGTPFWHIGTGDSPREDSLKEAEGKRIRWRNLDLGRGRIAPANDALPSYLPAQEDLTLDGMGRLVTGLGGHPQTITNGNEHGLQIRNDGNLLIELADRGRLSVPETRSKELSEGEGVVR